MKSPIVGSPFRVLASERGFTIAELLMAAFIGLIVLGASWGTVAMQGRSAAFQVGLADAQSAGRGAGALLLRDLRMAGFRMLGVSPDQNFPPIEYAESSGTATLTLRGAFSRAIGNLAASAAAGSTTITLAARAPTDPAFQVGRSVLLDSGLDSEVKVITNVSGNLTLELDSPLEHQYPVGPDVSQIESITYDWDGVRLSRTDGLTGGVVVDHATEFDLQFIDDAGVVSSVPGNGLRSVRLHFVAADPAVLPDSVAAQSLVSTEVNLRNLMFRFDLG